jgi:hypothetical protein
VPGANENSPTAAVQAGANEDAHARDQPSASNMDAPAQSQPAKMDGSPALPKPEAEAIVASSAFPRLSHHQWALAAQDLLQLETTPDVSGFSPDAPTGTGFDNTGDRLEVSEAYGSTIRR